MGFVDSFQSLIQNWSLISLKIQDVENDIAHVLRKENWVADILARGLYLPG